MRRRPRGPPDQPLSFVVHDRPSLAARTGWLVAAASLLLAAYLTWDGLRLRDQVATLSAQLAEAKALVAAADTRIASLQHAAERGTSAMAVLTAPDLARIDLVGQPDAPDARARAFWSRERGMVFSASRLPPPPPGKTYQVWVVTTDPAPISAGLIEPDPQGHVDVVFATPPDIAQPKAVAVTLEPAGGVPAPTGAKYLVGLGARTPRGPIRVIRSRQSSICNLKFPRPRRHLRITAAAFAAAGGVGCGDCLSF